MMRAATAIAMLWALAGLAAGCASAQSRFYTLNGTATAAPSTPSTV
jgi:hypothetical protein